MNITIKILLIPSVNDIPDDRIRNKPGAVMRVYDSDDICVSDGGGGLVLNRGGKPISQALRWGFVHFIGAPDCDVAALNALLTEYAEDEGEAIRDRTWRVDLSTFSAPSVAALMADRQVSLPWNASFFARLRHITILDPQDHAQDQPGRPFSLGELDG